MNYKLKAYFTLEATLLFPFIFFIMIWVIEIGIYQYNRCILMQEVHKILLSESSNYFISEEEQKENILLKKKLIDWESLIGLGTIQTHINVTDISIKVEIIADQNFPIGLPFQSTNLTVDIIEEVNRNSPLVILRRSKLLQDIKNGD